MSLNKGELDAYLLSELPTNGNHQIQAANLRNALGETFKLRTTVLTDTTTALTINDTDHFNKLIVFTNAADVTVTLPNDLPVGFITAFVQKGTGAVIPTAAAGASLNNRIGHTQSAGQYAVVTVICIANADDSSAEYIMTGDTDSAA